jgi:hypothetical protein
MKVQIEEQKQLYSFFNLGAMCVCVGEGWNQSHAPSALPPIKDSTHCIGGLVGPRDGLEGCGNSRR